MQIFEITQSQQLNEVNIGAAIKGAASAVGQAALQKIGQSAGISGTDYAQAVTDAPAVTGYGAQTAAAKAAEPVIKQQAQAAMQSWNNQLAQMAQAAKVQQPSQINIAQRKEQLEKFINDQLLGGRLSDYQNLPSQVDPNSFGGKAVQLAKTVVANIDRSMNTILNIDPTRSKTAQQQLADWTELAKSTYQATNMATFQQGISAPATQAARVADPRAASLMAAVGLNAADMAKLNAAMAQKGGFKGKPTGDPYIDGLLKTARLI